MRLYSVDWKIFLSLWIFLIQTGSSFAGILMDLEDYHRLPGEAGDYSYFLDRGNYFFEQEQYESALSHYRFARSVEPRLEQNFIFRFRLAFCLRETGNGIEAIPLLRPYENDSLVADYVLFQLAGCYASVPDSQQQAIQYYRKLLHRYPRSVFSVESALQLAELLTGTGRHDEALRAMAVAQEGMNREITLRRLYEPRVIYLKGLSAYQRGQYGRAMNYFRMLTSHYRHFDEALQARLWIQRLAKKRNSRLTTDQLLEMNQVLVLHGLYAEAITELKGYRETVSGKEQTAVDFQIARTYMAMGRYEEAARRFERLWQFRKHKESLFNLARVSRYMDNPVRAVAAYREYLKLMEKNSAWLNYTRFELANTLMATGDSNSLREAVLLYRQIRRPQSGSAFYAPGATFREAYVYYLLGKYDSALVIWSQMEEDYPSQKNRARYWMAKCHRRLGHHHQSDLMFRQLAAYRMTDYYGMLSELLYVNPSPVTPRRLFYITGIPFMRIPPVHLAETPSDSTTEKVVQLYTAMADDSLGRELRKVWLAEQLLGPRWAESELAPFRDRLRFSYPGLWSVKRLAEALRCYNIAVDVGVILRTYYETQLTRDEINRLNYPLYYSEAVQLYARQYGLDPSLLLAVIKAESAFRSRAVSPARALGLMQIMPFTGQSIAAEMQMADFQMKKLQTPEISIRMGGYYLHRQAKSFRGFIPAMLSAYNAGPHRTVFWMRFYNEEEPEAYPEMVDFTETHAYVKKILHDRWIYSLIYNSESS